MISPKNIMNKIGSNANTKASNGQIKIQQHDSGIKLFFYISKDGFTEPINGAVVHLRLMDKKNNVVMNRICDITDFEIAECLYVITSDDTKHFGQYNTEIQVNYANGTILSIENPFVLTIYPETIPWENTKRRV